MRTIGFGKPDRPLTPEPTPTEAFVLHEFGEAIAFAAGEWQRVQTSRQEADPAWLDRFTLRQRLLAFLDGPTVPLLKQRFGKIAVSGDEADALTETAGNADVICRLIVGEAIIASGGGTRAEVRSALPD